MKVTEKDVRYIAELSRLEISEEEMPMFTEQFNQILEYADILEKVDTAGIEPTFSILPLYNVMRDCRTQRRIQGSARYRIRRGIRR